MPDKKITELTELTEPAEEDLLPIVDDPGGSPVTKKITKSNLVSKVIAIPSADHSASGIKIVLTVAVSFNFGDVGYIDSNGKVALGDADAIANASCIVMCVDVSIGVDALGNFLMFGVVRDDTWNWTVGGLIYLSTFGATGDTLIQTAPSGTDDVIQILGVATHNDRMFFNPQLVQVEHT